MNRWVLLGASTLLVIFELRGPSRVAWIETKYLADLASLK